MLGYKRVHVQEVGTGTSDRYAASYLMAELEKLRHQMMFDPAAIAADIHLPRAKPPCPSDIFIGKAAEVSSSLSPT